jgi:hypothetical protein
LASSSQQGNGLSPGFSLHPFSLGAGQQKHSRRKSFGRSERRPPGRSSPSQSCCPPDPPTCPPSAGKPLGRRQPTGRGFPAAGRAGIDSALPRRHSGPGCRDARLDDGGRGTGASSASPMPPLLFRTPPISVSTTLSAPEDGSAQMPLPATELLGQPPTRLPLASTSRFPRTHRIGSRAQPHETPAAVHLVGR